MSNYRIKTISPLPTPKEIIDNSEIVDYDFINNFKMIKTTHVLYNNNLIFISIL